MSNKIKSIIKNPYFQITIVYLLAHFFMLILSGNWWDDLTFESHDLLYINEVASQSGRPEWNLLVPFCWSLPNNGRILIFFLYYLISLSIDNLLKNSDLFDKEDSLLITLLFIIIPVNEARILISNFAYTCGLTLFYITFALFVRWNKLEKSNKKIIYRIILLIMFYFSFILNSLLAYFYIVIFYLFVLEMKKYGQINIKNIFNSIKNVIIHYWDFIIVPFIYYGVNKIFFPTYGDVFGSYNSITISRLIKCIVLIPMNIFNSISSVLVNLSSTINLVTLFIIAMIILIYLWEHKNESLILSNNVVLCLCSLIVLAFGLLPYVVVRGNLIEQTGIHGRDSILVSLGIALFIFSICKSFGNKLEKISIIVLTILGICSFNRLYLEWQKDYYYQLAMEDELTNELIRDNDTFFLADLNESEISGQRFYGLNVNGYHVYQTKDRVFLPKVGNITMLKSKDSVEFNKNLLHSAYYMEDYNPDDYYLDAVIVYECEMSEYEVLMLKYHEIFNKDLFNKEIKEYGTMSVIEVDDDFTELLFDRIDNGEINSDEDLLLFLIDYKE